MILISHRGNLQGPNKERENSILYIQEALQARYDVEIDVWYVNKQFWLGHDEPQYKTDVGFLSNQSLWCHAKNLEALNEMLFHKIHCFWHEKDTVTLTSKNYIWAYIGVACKNSVAVLPETKDHPVKDHVGVCSDYIERYKK